MFLRRETLELFTCVFASACVRVCLLQRYIIIRSREAVEEREASRRITRTRTTGTEEKDIKSR